MLALAPYERVVREHSPLMAAIVVILLALLVVRMVVRTMTRTVLLGLLALAALVTYVERVELRKCTTTCSCSIATVDITLPACDPGFLDV